MKYTNIYVNILIAVVVFFTSCQPTETVVEKDSKYQKIDSLISVMTLDEKVGQLNLLVGDLFNTGPTVNTTQSEKFDSLIRQGKMTGLFNVHGTEYLARLQKLATEESRLGIPLVFGADVIHGFKTIFPIPLGSASSWDLGMIEKAEQVAAIESTAAGIIFNFAPMVDIARDPRWGRTAEGAGEDPYLGSLIAAARVKGFQGTDLTDPRTMAACVKHFAAYGAAFGGRDYNTTDMSERMLREVYLPPYKAAIDAGAATLMTSFNELDGIPATGNEFLLRQILRDEWGFDGMVVSDWSSVSEMIFHGNVADMAEAAALSIKAGTDMDMMAHAYINELPGLVTSGKVDEKLIDQAVYNVLKLKMDLGLFDNPYKYTDAEREKHEIRSTEHLAIAKEAAQKSIVLLKNEGGILPLRKDLKKVAIIGPYANEKGEHNGTWSFFGEAQHPVSISAGVSALAGDIDIVSHVGADFFDSKPEDITAAVALSRSADIIVAAVGEPSVMNGEGASRANIKIPENQINLLKELKK
ncbi:MAG: glycoside hydrolase family 3 C-terminal domain-containing protein, partial [Cyclobacteriaceae bacterium]|nr:glycoside hydrolase family 3 C-terminal domain-containing protein [Cyclobacteriaceae bacterium]